MGGAANAFIPVSVHDRDSGAIGLPAPAQLSAIRRFISWNSASA
jgi:hypothetical protein